MIDAIDRPLLSLLPQAQPGFVLAGSPIMIASQMPGLDRWVYARLWKAAHRRR
jgi:hypothetical protein